METDRKDGDLIGGSKVRSEEIGYGADEMAVCPGCQKSNPPNRSSCLYCAKPLQNFRLDRRSVKLNLRELENWENGYNVVLASSGGSIGAGEIEKFFGLGAEDAEALTGAKSIVPLARLESESDASVAVDYLAEIGMKAYVVGDVFLKAKKPNIRARSIEFLPEGLSITSFNTGESVLISPSELTLIVSGTVSESRSESIGKPIRKGERKVLSESATVTDDRAIDLYTQSGRGWRIITKGFDFSGLGTEKGMLSGENMDRLILRLRQTSAGARFIDEYDRLRQSLTSVWPLDVRRDFDGLKRTGIWQSGFSNVVRSSNLDQFSKYSCLQRIGS